MLDMFFSWWNGVHGGYEQITAGNKSR